MQHSTPTRFPRPKPPPAAVLAALFVVAGAVSAGAQRDVCRTDPRYSALDFALGEWQLENAAGEVLGSSRVSKRPDGCAIVESYRGTDGTTGETLTYLDPAEGAWKQVGIGSSGDVFQNRGQVSAEAFEFEGSLARPNGETMQLRGTLQRDGDRVHYRVENRSGDTWTLLEEGDYRPISQVTRKKSGKAAKDEKSAAEVAPVVTTAPSTVEVVPIPEERRVQTLSARALETQDIEVESPMVLQFAVGPVENLPEGYGWSTAETAQYVCRQTRINKISVVRVKRKGQLALEVTSEIHTKQYVGQYGLLVELLDGEAVVASAEDARFKGGRGVPQQAQTGALLKTLSIELDSETFDRLFSASERPEMRVQLTVY